MAAQSRKQWIHFSAMACYEIAKDLLASGQYSYLDVRIPELFKKGHVENALNVPFFLSTPEGRVKNPQFLEQVSSLCSKDDPLLVGCYSGGRSMLASVDLLNAGFKNAKNVGGHSAWVEKGFPGIMFSNILFIK